MQARAGSPAASATAAWIGSDWQKRRRKTGWALGSHSALYRDHYRKRWRRSRQMGSGLFEAKGLSGSISGLAISPSASRLTVRLGRSRIVAAAFLPGLNTRLVVGS